VPFRFRPFLNVRAPNKTVDTWRRLHPHNSCPRPPVLHGHRFVLFKRRISPNDLFCFVLGLGWGWRFCENPYRGAMFSPALTMSRSVPQVIFFFVRFPFPPFRASLIFGILFAGGRTFRKLPPWFLSSLDPDRDFCPTPGEVRGRGFVVFAWAGLPLPGAGTAYFH